MTIETVDRADQQLSTAARAIQQAAREVDGTAPFSEQTELSWAAGRDGARHLLSRTAAGLPAGYAYLDPDGWAELAVHPDHRRRGHGRALLDLLSAELPDSGLQVWSHGDRPQARALAASAGFAVVRELLQLRHTLTADPAPDGVTMPAGTTLRSFRPGIDDDAWLALNSLAFAHHPEQGRMTRADLRARIDEPWFDPDGFLIAHGDDGMAGFHWTKVHPEGLGEIYVLGVDPARHGSGLGGALTRAGLSHLYRRGLRTVLLYVEAGNSPALAVYHRAGFATFSRDVMYARG